MCSGGQCFRFWSRKWLVISDHYVCYTNGPEDTVLHEVMMIDTSFKIKRGYIETGLDYGLIIENRQRRLLIKCENAFEHKKCMDALLVCLRVSPLSPLVERKHDSFAPQRTDA